jgi:hypothetical protein
MIAPPGRRAADTFASFAAAAEAMFGWGLAAHAAGIELATLAAWFNRENPARVVVTLAEREYFKRLQRLAGLGTDAETTAALSHADPRDVLRIFVVDSEGVGASTVSLTDMKEGLYGR